MGPESDTAFPADKGAALSAGPLGLLLKTVQPVGSKAAKNIATAKRIADNSFL